jgi:hypothetical protein
MQVPVSRTETTQPKLEQWIRTRQSLNIWLI